MTREALIDLLRNVLGDHPVLAALARTNQLAAVEDILLARPPERAAVVADMDGILRVSRNGVGIETSWGLEPVVVEPARLVVANGANVAAGDRLTDGEVSLADTMRVFGQRVTMERIADALGRLLDISRDAACEVATPMVMMIDASDRESNQLGVVRMSAACFEAAYDLLGDHATIVGQPVVVGYDVLVAHRDPPRDMFAKHHAEKVARLAEEAARLATQAARLAELEPRALAGDRVALQHLVLGCMEPDATPDAPGPDDTMLVCREASPGTFELSRANDGTWRLDCLTTHSHFRNASTVAAVIAERPALEQFLALPPGSNVHFKDFLKLRTRRETFPTPDSFVHRRMTHTREGALSLDAELTELALRGELATAVAVIGERMLIPSWRAKDLVEAVRPKWQPSNDFDRELLEIVDARGKIAAISRYREASGTGLADAKNYIDRLVAQRSS